MSGKPLIPLFRSTLAQLPPTLARPAYDVAAVTAGIVHLGPGVFHRAHMARYTHDLMALQPEAQVWGIAGAGLLPADRRIVDALAAQDGLYTLTERQDDAEAATVVGAVCELIYAGDSAARLLARIDDPAIRIVSLTVSENGYCLDPATKRLDPAHPAIIRDLSGSLPASSIGVLVEAYRRRRAAEQPAFSALSCDNMQHNGATLRAAVLAFADLRDRSLASWIDRNATFPGTMVDRITPGTTDADIADVAERYGVADRWPVSSEMFRQWVIEERFVAGRPAWEAVGVQMVDNVAPYEYMKLRLLNASHLAVAALGQLAGYVHVDETMRDPAFAVFMQALMDRETGPTVPPVSGVDLTVYKKQLIARFANSRVKDTLQRINTDAPLNLLLDPIRDRLSGGGDCELLGLALAAWMRRLLGKDDRGFPLVIAHPEADLLRDRAARGGTDPRPLLGIRSLFGDLGENEPFVAGLARHLTTLDRIGVVGAIEQTISAVMQGGSLQGIGSLSEHRYKPGLQHRVVAPHFPAAGGQKGVESGH